MVAPYILSTIPAVPTSLLHTKMCYQLICTKQKGPDNGDSRSTSELWVLSMGVDSSHPSGAQNLEMAARVLEDWWSPVLMIIMYESLYYGSWLFTETHCNQTYCNYLNEVEKCAIRH